MRYKLLFSLLCMISSIVGSAYPVLQSFDREAFYSVMALGKLGEINDELFIVSASMISEKEAYEGALLMRKAGLLKKAEEKIKIFKAGRIKLEMALRDDEDNGEYRFLRITIQEHAPHVVKYYKELEKDSHFLEKHFKTLSPAVQKAILDYCKNSKVLKQENFQFP